MSKGRFSEIATGFVLESGYGQQMAVGAGRFRAKRPDWLFIRYSMSYLDAIREMSAVGGIGHFYSDEHIQVLKQRKVPFIVSVSSRADPENWFRVIPDNYEAGKMAAEYFLKKGYANYASIDMEISFARERLNGFCDTLREKGISDPKRIIISHSGSIELKDCKLPLAIFVPTDRLALKIMNELIAQGIRVPEDVALLGVDNDEIVSTFAPIPLSSVRLPFERIGFAACEALEEMIRTQKQRYGTKLLKPIGVIERRSTETVHTNDLRVRNALAFIKDHLAEIDGVEHLAKKLHLNRRTLDRLFVRNLGLTPAEWLMRCRSEYAEKLVIETDYTIDYIAELAGFGDRRCLYRAFKRQERPLPRILRKGRQASGR